MSYRRPPRIDGMFSLKVNNLPCSTTPGDLQRIFEKYGEIADIYIPKDRVNKESRGFAFVRFYNKSDADDARNAMDGRVFDGKKLRVHMSIVERPNLPYRRGGRSNGRRRRSRSRSRSQSRSRRRSYSRSSRSSSESSHGRSRSHSRSSSSSSTN